MRILREYSLLFCSESDGFICSKNGKGGVFCRDESRSIKFSLSLNLWVNGSTFRNTTTIREEAVITVSSTDSRLKTKSY